MPQLAAAPIYLQEYVESTCLALLLLSLVTVYLVPELVSSRIACLLVTQKHSPLEQFSSHSAYPGLTSVGWYSVLTLVAVTALSSGLQAQGLLVTRSGARLTLTSLRDTSAAVIGSSVSVQSLLSFIVMLVLLIGLGNLEANVPFGYAFTTSVVVTGVLSLTVWLWVLGLTLAGQGLRFWGSFVPAGTPLMLVPVLVPIEALSYLARLVSLGVRLFSNILSGHTLLAILAGFLIAGLESGWVVSLLSLAFLGVYTSLIFLELAVSLIQAYVFAVLTVSYLEGAFQG